MKNHAKIDRLLKDQAEIQTDTAEAQLREYSRMLSEIENVTVVLSDIARNESRIYPGAFGERLGIANYSSEHSIWEKLILDLMDTDEQEEKFISELRFFNFIKRLPKKHRSDYYLASQLKMRDAEGKTITVLHRMNYIFSTDMEKITHAVCTYGCQPFNYQWKSVAVNALTGVVEELTSERDHSILSSRELSVLKLIDSGKKSREIAEILSISKNTVSRHRQEILAKLQASNSIEACRTAKTLGLL